MFGYNDTERRSWMTSNRLIAFGLTDGGTAGLIYGFIICLAGFTCVYLSIAEMVCAIASSILEAEVAGCDDTITKPFRMAELLPKIQMLIN